MIFYFSCTGNTLWAARKISEATGERLISIAALSHEAYTIEPDADESIGFCFPVHGWRPPVVVRRWMRRLTIRQNGRHYCWALCTAGDDIGETIDIMRHDLEASGIRISATLSLLMPESYVGLPFMDVDTPEKEREKIIQAGETLDKYIGIITRRQEDSHLHLSHWPRVNSRLLGHAFVKWLLTDKPFRCDGDKCTHCGRCARACPTGNIVMDADDTPIWEKNGQCISCFACYHHCPVHAINYGHRTQKKGQYYFGRNDI